METLSDTCCDTEKHVTFAGLADDAAPSTISWKPFAQVTYRTSNAHFYLFDCMILSE